MSHASCVFNDMRGEFGESGSRSIRGEPLGNNHPANSDFKYKQTKQTLNHSQKVAGNNGSGDIDGGDKEFR